MAWAIAAFAGFRIDERRGAAIALAAMLLAQPTIGFNYAGVLFPAMALLWARDRQIGTVAFVAGSLLVLVVPVGAAALVIVLAIASWIRSPGPGSAPGDSAVDGRGRRRLKGASTQRSDAQAITMLTGTRSRRGATPQP